VRGYANFFIPDFLALRLSMKPHDSRPAELRAKTDRDLVRIIDNALEVGAAAGGE
jgi:hypothetical protein